MQATRRHLTVMVALLLIIGNASAGVYRWVDEQGQVHYGDKPPPGAEPVQTRLPSLSGRPAAAAEDTDEEETGNIDPAVALQQCTAARELLFSYEQAPRLMKQTSLGEQGELTAQERDQLLAIQRGKVADACNESAAPDS